MYILNSRKGYVYKMGEAGLGYYKDYQYGGAKDSSSSPSSSKIVEIVDEPHIEEAGESAPAPSFGDGGIDDLD